MWQSINETLSEFCSSTFWDSNLTWNSPNPDFTICFEKSILVWIPCAFLWIFLPREIYSLYQSKQFGIPFNRYNISKLVVIAMMVTGAIIDTANYMVLDKRKALIDIYSPVVKLLTSCLFFGLTYGNLKRGIKSSNILFLFSFLLAVCGTPEFRTELNSWHHNSMTMDENSNFQTGKRISCFVYYPAVIAIFLLNCFSDTSLTASNGTLDKNACPQNESSALSRIFFAWFDSFAWKGYKRPITDDDLWDIEHDLKTTNISRRFESEWHKAFRPLEKDAITKTRGVQYKPGKSSHTEENNEKISMLRHPTNVSSKKASILSPLCKAFGWSMLFAFVLKFIHGSLNFASPLLLKYIIAFVGDKNELLWHGYFYSILLVVVGVLRTLFWNQYTYVAFHLGLQLRTALTSIIYKKTLRISSGARKEFTLGEIVNLMTVDAERFYLAALYFSQLIVAPIEFFTAMYLLWEKLGVSVLAGLLVWIILMPINYVLVSWYHTNISKQMSRKDKRVKLINEVLSGIKVLKLYAWEPSFGKEITKIHEKEIKITKKMSYMESFAWGLWTAAPFAVTLVTFAVYVLSDEKNVLDAETVFVSLSLFNILRSCVMLIPQSTAYLSRTNVSVKRINEFLNSEELDPDAVSHEERFEPVIIENGHFSWESCTEEPLLNNINLRVEPHTLVAVVGLVGSGKSSLLSAILGEMYLHSGFVNTKGTVAYVPQQAWIQNATLEKNITFGAMTNRTMYSEIIEACALKDDLKILPGGDQTEIGEKGVNVSGGQKQRISLARAVYSNADIYLLDDPLSAVDAHVGKHIFEQVISADGLLKQKTRIWVTHNLTYLPQVDQIVVLQHGSILASGTYDELMKTNEDFARIIATHGGKEDDESSKSHQSKNTHNSESDTLLNIQCRHASISELDCSLKPVEVIAGQKLIEEETTETGNIDCKVYLYYLKPMGSFLIVITLFLSLLYQFFLVASNYWLTVWSGDKSIALDGNESQQYVYMSVYGILGVAQVLCVSLQTITLLVGALKAAMYIHSYLLTSVLHWPATTFDKIPSGRIINRFSSDIEILQNLLPLNLLQILLNTAAVLSTLFVISYTTPAFILVIPFLGAFYFFVERFFTATSRQLKRLESKSKSPVYSHMSETVSGVQSIRAQNLQSMFVRQLEDKIDFNQKSAYSNVIAERWLSLRLELAGTMITFFAALFAILSRDTLGTEIVGWSVSIALQITSTLYLWIRMISETETNIVAIERIKQYDDVEREADWETAGENVPKDWPSKGEVVVEGLAVRYQEGTELVLKGISFHAKSGEKVGIVGRTGAGKSSLTLSLFRIIEPAKGRILIDGIDASKIGLHSLRSRLTIIPQDPVLFSGTLRINLDPTDTYSDNRLWEALEQANLKTFVSTLKFGLQSEVVEGGSNFSVGQRQLICLARAVLRKTKLLIMDEATAAVDVETDNLIQTTIQKAFKDSTVLTIAHRLNTVLDYDRIIVLDKGRIVEFDSPTSLLKSKQSLFYQMASDAKLV